MFDFPSEFIAACWQAGVEALVDALNILLIRFFSE